ncbi:MAG: hypothetical protein IPL53_12655 [Ignavibacteria bacterium]|nr:hypothetical protein [Ignavibacteria bacterium]
MTNSMINGTCLSLIDSVVKPQNVQPLLLIKDVTIAAINATLRNIITKLFPVSLLNSDFNIIAGFMFLEFGF